MEFEDILVKVGDYGKYQKKLIALFLFPSAMLLAPIYMNNLFMIALPDYWCHVPELEPFNLTMEQQKLLIRPKVHESCLMYDVNYTDILTSSMGNWSVSPNTSTKACENGWNFDKTNYDYTAATQFEMYCENSHYTSFLLTMSNVGSIIGTPIYGSLSDKIGRRLSFFVVVTITSITGIISIFMTNFTAFIVLRTINGALMPSIFQLPFIILLEIVGPHMRTRMNGIANASWTVGMCILPLIAWLTKNWVTFGVITSLMTFLYFLYWPILPESPRWYLTREKYSEATEIMTDIAKTNGKSIEPADIFSYIKKLGERIKKEKKSEKEDSTSLWKYPQLRKKFLIITYCWIADITAYYGLQFNVSNLAGNEFLNFFLLAIAELPGFICSWLFMETLGRRWCSVSALILTAIFCVISAVFPETGVGPSFAAKFCCSVSFMAVYQQSSELYPTSVRALGLGLSATFAGAATIAVPYIPYLDKYGEYIPFAIIAFLTFTAGISAAFLPETLNENLPQTVLDAETFGAHQKFFSYNRRRRPSCHIDMISPSGMNGVHNSSDNK